MKTSKVAGSGLYVAITGARRIKVVDVEEALRAAADASGGLTFQLFDAAVVAGWRHLFHAAVNAVNAVENGFAVSKGLDVETLLYASCHDQISRAFKAMGVSKATRDVAVLVFGEDREAVSAAARRIAGTLGEEDDGVLQMSESKQERLMKTFNVSKVALESVGGDPREALASMIIEAGALLSLRR
jgi:tRNA threonylcarbamoyladenosine modification (KEOPS) complex Cgi121 subunit